MKKFIEDEEYTLARSREHIKHESDCNMRPPMSMLMKEISQLFLIAVKRRTESSEGIKFSRSGILRYLSRHDGASQQELAHFLRLSPPTVSTELSEMERDGLVTRTRSEQDARSTVVSLTDRGASAELAIKREFEYTEREMLKGLSPQEQSNLTAALLGMRENILALIDKENQ